MLRFATMDKQQSQRDGPARDSDPFASDPASGARRGESGSGRRFDPTGWLHDFQQRVVELVRSSPAGDLERQLKSLMTQTFERMDLVTREDFQIQVELLERLRDRVDALETRLREQDRETQGPPVDPGD